MFPNFLAETKSPDSCYGCESFFADTFFAILSTGGYHGEAGKGNQGDPIKLEILPDKFIGPGFGGQHPGANLG